MGKIESLGVVIKALRQIEDSDGPYGEWSPNVPEKTQEALFSLGLVWRDGPDNEYLRLTDAGERWLNDVDELVSPKEPAYYTITPEDVGRWQIFAFGKFWTVAHFMGRILQRDIGKRVYRRGDIVQVENDEQRARRVTGRS